MFAEYPFDDHRTDAIAACLVGFECVEHGTQFLCGDSFARVQKFNGRTGKYSVYGKVDNIVILPSCIAVVHVESMRGQIFGGSDAVWHQSIRLPGGERRETDFENPILANEKNIIALTQIFEREKIATPPIYNIIIFSSNKVLFSDESAEVYSLSAAIAKLKALAKGKKIPFKERITLRKIIKKYSLHPKKARLHNAKVQRALAGAETKNPNRKVKK